MSTSAVSYCQENSVYATLCVQKMVLRWRQRHFLADFWQSTRHVHTARSVGGQERELLTLWAEEFAKAHTISDCNKIKSGSTLS